MKILVLEITRYTVVLHSYALHFSFLNRGQNDSNRVEEKLKEPVSSRNLVLSLVLTHTADVKTQGHLHQYRRKVSYIQRSTVC